MTSVIFARINELHKDKKLYYHVNALNKRIKKNFDTIDEAHTFLKKIAIDLLSTNEISKLAIWYERIDKRASYLIYEVEQNEKIKKTKIVEYELSSFDFVDTHRAYFRKHQTAWMINERYYSFHDIARLLTLPKKGTTYLKIALGVINIIAAVFFLFYGISFINKPTINARMQEYQKVFFMIITFFGFIAISISSILLFMSFWPVLRKIDKVKWNYDDIDWWRETRKKNFWLTYALIFVNIGTAAIVIFLVEYMDSPLWDLKSNDNYAYFIISSVSIFSFVSVGISSLLSFLNVSLWKKRNMSKYFTKEEIVKYKQWLKNSPSNIIYKSDKDYFLLDFDENETISLIKVSFVHEVMKMYDAEDLEIFKNKAREHYYYALEKYLKSDEYRKVINER